MYLGKRVCKRVGKEVVQKNQESLRISSNTIAALMFPDQYDTVFDVGVLTDGACCETLHKRWRTQL